MAAQVWVQRGRTNFASETGAPGALTAVAPSSHGGSQEVIQATPWGQRTDASQGPRHLPPSPDDDPDFQNLEDGFDVIAVNVTVYKDLAKNFITGRGHEFNAWAVSESHAKLPALNTIVRRVLPGRHVFGSPAVQSLAAEKGSHGEAPCSSPTRRSVPSP